MSDHEHPAYQATKSETLEQLVMDPRVEKIETEWWAYGEIKRLRARVSALEETLGLLVDHQNGCPLPSYEEKWNRAMADAKNLLGGAP